MDRRTEGSGRRLRRKIALFIAVMCLTAFACGTASEPPSRPTNPERPAGQDQSESPNESEPPDEPEPQEEPPRPIDPDDLIAHGAGPDTPNRGEGCGGSRPAIAICSYGGNSKILPPQALSATSQVALGEWVVVGGCNFPVGERVSVSITSPGGMDMNKGKDVPASTTWNAAWWITPDWPLGSYQLEVNSTAGNFNETIQVVAPDEPLLTTGFVPGRREGVFALAGFQPNEQVLIARYEVDLSSGTTTLLDHQFLGLNSEGSIIGQLTSIPVEDTMVVVIGQETPIHYTTMPVSAFDYFSPEAVMSDTRYVCTPRGLPILDDLPDAQGDQELAPPG